jgi:hypothetical protein
MFVDQAHLCLDYAVDKLLESAGVEIGQNPIVMDIIVVLAVGVIVYPLCIVKEFHRIKVSVMRITL